MKNPLKSHRSTVLFTSPFSIRVQVCSCSLRPVLPSLLSIHLIGSPADCLLGFSPASHGTWVCGSSSPPPEGYHSILLFTQVNTLPTIHLLTMFSSLVPVLPHANLNTVFPTPLHTQTQSILVSLMRLPGYKHPCTPKLSPNYSVHAA